MPKRTTGQPPFAFALCEDLYTLPQAAQAHERDLHGGFARDTRPGRGQLYYGMPGAGLLRVSPDLTQQDLIELPEHLKGINFHSTKLGEFDGKTRLFMPANKDEMVVILTLEGEVDFILSRPEFEEYQDAEQPFRPTDTVLAGNRLLVADGYGSNYINAVDLTLQRWAELFGGKGSSPDEHGSFGTAHGLNLMPAGSHVAIADRPHSRLEVYTYDGTYTTTYPLPANSRPCGIDYTYHDGAWYAVVGSLDDPEKGRPAPIYILDGSAHTVLSTIRPKEDLGVELADHIHNVVWHEHNGRLFLVCQAWNPGHYFVLERV